MLAQRWIIGTGFIEICGALASGQFQRGAKNGHFAISWRGHEKNLTGGNKGNRVKFRIARPIRFMILAFFGRLFVSASESICAPTDRGRNRWRLVF